MTLNTVGQALCVVMELQDVSSFLIRLSEDDVGRGLQAGHRDPKQEAK